MRPRINIRLGGPLLGLVFGAGFVGQYLLNRGEGMKSLASYLIAVAAFLLLIFGQSRIRTMAVPIPIRWPLIGNALRSAFGATDSAGLSSWRGITWDTASRWRRSAAAAAAIALSAAFWQVSQPHTAGLITLGLWSFGLTATLAAALPGEALRSPWILELRDRALSREGAVVCGLVLVGGFVRVFDLAHFPSGVHGDEASFALVAIHILKGQLIDPFGPIFLADNALLAYLDAPFLALFGPTITGMRVLGAISGALALPAFYLLIRRMFGSRPAMIALALAVGNAALVHFSRLALNVPQVSLFMCLSFWALWEGRRTQRAFWWLASGVAGAMPIYFHFSGLLFPPLLGSVFAYLLVTQRGERLLWLRGALVTAGAGLLAAAPRVLETLRGEYGAQEHVGSRFIFANWSRVTGVQHTTSPLVVVLGQIRTNLLGFFNLADASDFYTFARAPLITPILGPLVALALVLMFARIRDARYGLLAIWFWTVLIVGGALSIDSPSAHRLLTAVFPALAGVALLLNWLADVGLSLFGQLFQPVFALLLAAIPLLAGVTDLSHYFGPAAASKPFELPTTQAEYIASLGNAYEIRVLGVPQMYFSSPDTQFLAPRAQGGDLASPAEDLPLAIAPDHDLAFIVYGWMSGYLPLLRSVYPDGRLVPVPGRTGPVFDAYLVSRQEIAQSQGLMADYGRLQRLEADTDSLGGGPANYPANVTWSGSVYFDKVGRYQFNCSGRCELLLDGEAVPGADALNAATGWHSVKLTAQLKTADDRLSLRWQQPGTEPMPIPASQLDMRPIGGKLKATVESGADSFHRVDRALGSRNTWQMLAVGQPATVSWRGSLNVPASGQYGLTLEADSDANFAIDGEQVLRTGGGATRSTRNLTAGEHAITVEYRSVRNPGMLELSWTPPGGQQTIIPPEAYGPPRLSA